MSGSVLDSEIITPELRRELNHLKAHLLRALADTIPLDPDISDADLVRMAYEKLEIHKAFRKT